jgi:hypothetical protein
MTYLSIIWLIFALVFLILGTYHWKLSNKNISHLKIKDRLAGTGAEIYVEIAGIDMAEFLEKFNLYVDSVNQSTIKEHKVQAIGYWIACGTAFLSFALTFVG